MDRIDLMVNGQMVTVELDPNTPLLWVLRDTIGLTGTKYSCGIGQCGTCTIHLDGEAVRSCSLPVSQAAGKAIITIEGLSEDGSHPVQQAFHEENAPQCGYCMPGQVMTMAAFLQQNPTATEDQILAAMKGNYCRCGTYQRIRKAAKRIVVAGGGS